jgi:hypothetical protein
MWMMWMTPSAAVCEPQVLQGLVAQDVLFVGVVAVLRVSLYPYCRRGQQPAPHNPRQHRSQWQACADVGAAACLL